MKVEVRIDPACGEPEVTITAPALTDEVRALAARLEGGGGASCPGPVGPSLRGGYSAPPVCRGLMDVLGLPGAAVTLGLCFGFGAAVGGHAAFRDGRKNARPGPNCQGRAYRRSRRHLASRPGGAAHFAGYQHIPGN